MHVILTQSEITVLLRQNPETSQDGGFQGFLVSLQDRVNRTTGELSGSSLFRMGRECSPTPNSDGPKNSPSVT